MEKEEKKKIKKPESQEPVWKKIIIESYLPDSLAPLSEFSKNLWWSWNTQSSSLFKYIDDQLWKEHGDNPVAMLGELSYKRFQELENDSYFLSEMNKIHQQFRQYMDERKELSAPQIAYFSMEYGLHDSLKIYSGGLGILAGDYLKEASDMKVNMIGMGLLYRYGYFKQVLNLHGEQMANYEYQDFSKIPVQPVLDENGEWMKIEVEFPGRKVIAQIMQVNIGSVKLYLLNADVPGNTDEDRSVTHHLYGGNRENRLKQEIFLGIGGIRALEKLGYTPDIYHCNEGHSAFIGLERMVNLIEKHRLSYAEAKEVVRSSTVFTTHTPVPAGHDSFHNDLFKNYMESFPARLGIDWEEFDMLGKTNHSEDHFNMSYLACNLSQGINGVSKLHGEVTKSVLKSLYKGYLEEELEIGYVTNGVHYSSWTAGEWKGLFKEYFDEKFPDNQLDYEVWDHIYQVPDEKIWELRKTLRSKMISYFKERLSDNWIKRNENPKLITEVKQKLNPSALTIGFARRFATYKRGYLIFRDLDRLSKIVNNPDCPVQFIFAGKAHPADKEGQELIKYIVEISKRPEFLGKILFVQNYDISLAKKLLQGVDVWLNTPTRPLEASGTSGQKGIMNGTLHFSVLDGWWVEGYRKDAGWALPAERSYDVQDFQDELDAESIYNILEEEIIKTFYDRNKEGVPVEWVDYIKNTIALVAPHFTTGRMMKDYHDRYYLPQLKRYHSIINEDFKWAKELAAWKHKIYSAWNDIELKRMEIADDIKNVMTISKQYPIVIEMDLKGLTSNDIGIEFIVTEVDDEVPGIVRRLDFEAEKSEGNNCIFRLNYSPLHPGTFNYGIRVYPKNDGLPHRQDIKLVKWL